MHLAASLSTPQEVGTIERAGPRFAVTLSAVLGTTSVAAAAPTSAAPSIESAPALDALRDKIGALVIEVGDGQGPGRGRACKTNSEGVCVYRDRQKFRRGAGDPSHRSLSADERALLAAYEAFLADTAGAAAPEAAAYRYHLARLLDEAGETGRARVHLERLTGSDGHPRAAWAAALLVDGLVREWSAAESTAEQRQAAGRELRRQLARLSALPLWGTVEAAELRAAAPRIEAGLRWATALEHRERGRTAIDPDAAAAEYMACAREFQAIYADFRDRHDRAATLLWNAADCLDAAHDVDAALAVRVALVDAFPDSEHTATVLRYIAGTHDALGRFAEAARWYERFAAHAPRDHRTADALARAFEIRLALGPRDRLMATLAAYEGYHARRDPRRAAEIRWAAHPVVAADDRARRADAEAFLRAYGNKGPPALGVTAGVELAGLLLRATCPNGLIMGELCLTIEGDRVGAAGGRARPLATKRWGVARRAGADHDEALRLAGWARARARHTRREVEELRGPVFADAVATAALIEADALFEELVAGRPSQRRAPLRRGGALRLAPEELPWDAGRIRQAPPPGFAAIAADVSGDVDELDRAYAAVAELVPDSPVALRARARQGLLREWLADRSAASPNERSPADVLRAAALVAYRQCLAPTAAGLAARETVDVCERRAAALAPGDPHVVRELFGPIDPGEFGHAASRPDVVGVIVDVEEALRSGARLVGPGGPTGQGPAP